MKKKLASAGFFVYTVVTTTSIQYEFPHIISNFT